MTSDKGTSPPCGIYLHIEAAMSGANARERSLKILREVAMVINRASAYEKNMHAVCFDAQGADRAVLRGLIEAVRMSGLVPLITGCGVDVLQESGAEGVLLRKPEEIAPLREVMGPDVIIGLEANLPLKDLAMAGADFVIIPAQVSVVEAWGMLSAAPCVVRERTLDALPALVRAGAGFVDMSAYILDHPKGVMQGVVNVLDALES